MARYDRRVKLNVAAKVYGKRVKGLEEAIKKGLLSACMHGVADIQGVVIPNTLVLERNGIRKAPPVDRGMFKAGWRAGPTPDGARIYHINPKIAAIMEDGVRAGNVKIGKGMIDALTAWAHRHSLERPKRDAKSVAWAIAKHMQRYGMAPRRILARERPRIAEYAQKEVGRFVTKHLADVRKQHGG